MSLLSVHRADLAALASADRLRSLAARTGVDFASNDYIGLAGSERLHAAASDALARSVPIGSGGSRLLRGNHPEHEALEAEAAAFFGAEAALFLANGFVANMALFATLPQRGDLVVYDALLHASAHDGMRLGRAERVAAAHNDVAAFEDAIAAWRTAGGSGRVWIAVESLYSMDGDQAPLAELAALAERHDAFLLIDEAHATGVFGPDGRGLAEAFEGRPNVVTLHSCGKALGAEGALLCLPAVLRDMLVNRARGFVFSTAPSPLIAAVVRDALRALAEEPWRRDDLRALIAAGGAALAPLGAIATGSPILPLILGDDARTMHIARSVQAQGFDVRGIRPPTVPEGTARLRISLTLNATPADVEALAAALKEALT
ncbi:8-amino-7-oxononanoate synthase [Sphingomonas qomolangmaensis]|uniref:8-amino-7-oxononanoate synthase n=1 Tax=Sphingomonas qomolangmaensis TaxID=2918765 RepID=A0ABY5L957_9SPHN|nr:8-amino-7-oxononanoate synthase [Sphingomonas qomolangmaensis]UUL82290.1 8-amino-7-oxononanoate synthase [Sphingomonas qomolangmaensis]